MKAIYILLIIAFLTENIQAQYLYITGKLPKNIKTSSKLPCPTNKCNIFVMERGTSEFKLARTYSNQLVPSIIAKTKISPNSDFVFVKIISPGFGKWTELFPVIHKEDSLIINLGTIKLNNIPSPKIDNIIPSIHQETDNINYQINLSNSSTQDYNITMIKLTMFFNYNFTSAGINNIEQKYVFSNKLFMRSDSSITFYTKEMIRNPEYMLNCNGNISFLKSEDIISVTTTISTHFTLPSEKKNYYIQLELPSTIQLENIDAIKGPIFKNNSFLLSQLKIKSIEKIIIELKTTNYEIPSICYEKKL